jgi:hypothetical protein
MTAIVDRHNHVPAGWNSAFPPSFPVEMFFGMA